MNSTEVQNPQHKLDDVFMLCHMCSVLSLLVQSLLNSSLNTLPQTVRLFYVSLRSQAPQQQYTVNCMHYGITLWAYLSELLVKELQTSDGKTTIPHAQVT